MNRIKKILNKSLLLGLLLGLFLTGCSNDNTDKDKVPNNTEIKSTEETMNDSPTNLEHNDNLVDVVRVVDGDTIVVKLNGKDEKVRFLLIDTPESVHANASKNTEFGKVASDFTKNLLEGKQVSLEFDVAERDKYGRLLAYVYLDDQMVNETLLKEGMAKVAVFQPNVKYVDQFRKLEKEAQENKVGIWSDGVSAFSGNPKTNDKKEVSNKSDNVVTGDYIANSNTMKLHLSSCRHADSISDHNKVSFSNRDEAVNKGYEPCKVCNP